MHHIRPIHRTRFTWQFGPGNLFPTNVETGEGRQYQLEQLVIRHIGGEWLAISVRFGLLGGGIIEREPPETTDLDRKMKAVIGLPVERLVTGRKLEYEIGTRGEEVHKAALRIAESLFWNFAKRYAGEYADVPNRPFDAKEIVTQFDIDYDGFIVMDGSPGVKGIKGEPMPHGDFLRKRHGAGTTLIKPGIMSPPDANIRFLSWIKAKHRQHNAEFVRTLVSDCASEFGCRNPLNNEERAKIYTEIKQKTPDKDIERLRKHGRLRCNS
jgi:hypothetical protein